LRLTTFSASVALAGEGSRFAHCPTAAQHGRRVVERASPRSRVRVEDALAAAVALIAEHPDVGPTYPADPRYRTWRLEGTPYILFYRVDEAADTVWVVAAWSGRRGAGPELP
jgi:plasmid stabilization system protein ParE